MAGLSLSTGNKRAPLAERGNDLYETPPEATWALLREERLPHFIWEPCCGRLAIANVLRKSGHEVLATDLVDYGWAHWSQAVSGIDFLMQQPTKQGPPRGAIVTNPPFKLAARFVEHGLYRLKYPKVVMLLRLAFLEGGNIDNEAGNARRAALDGGHLARVLIFRKRLPMMHRDGWEGRKANSGMAFAWFVWDLAHTGPTELRRIDWQPVPALEAA